MLFNLAYGLVTKAAANRQSQSAHIVAKRRVLLGRLLAIASIGWKG
jgi:hypothetical protein